MSDRQAPSPSLRELYGLVHSSPDVVSTNHCDTNESAELNLVWSLQFHKKQEYVLPLVGS
jgi:hypothetical protein